MVLVVNVDIGKLSSERFKRLFSTPPLTVSIPLNVAVYLFLVPSILSIVLSTGFIEGLVRYSLPTLTSLMLGFTIVTMKTPIMKVNYIRRIAAYPTYVLIVLMPSLILLTVLKWYVGLDIPPYFTVPPTASILYIISRSTTKRGVLTSTLPSLTLIIPLIPLTSDMLRETVLILFTSLTSILAGEFYFQTIVYIGRRVGVNRHIELFRGFAREWLANDPSELERELSIWGEDVGGFIKIMSFKGSNKNMLVQVSYHTGPMRDVGGSNLPSAISSMLSEEGILSLNLHPPSNHVLDPISRDEKSRLLGEVLKCISSGGWVEAYLKGRPFKISKNHWELHVYPFHPSPLIFICRELGIDDLPPRLNDVALEEARRLGFKDCMLVESHNTLLREDESIEDEELEELALLVREALVRSASQDMKLKPKVGMVKINKAHIGSECYDICSDGISLLALNVRGEKYLVIVIDGNNMEEFLKKRIEEKCYSLGYKLVTIATTDSHELTGRITGTSGYVPVGGMCSSEILKAIDEGLKIIESNVEEVEISYKRCNVRKLKVLGLRGLEIIEKVLEGPGNYASKTLLPTLIIINVLLTLIASAIY